MREHKFRGIEKNTGKFVYGGIAYEVLTASGFIADVAIMPPRCYGIEVDPDTVGEYTGLKDCEGVEIYEGDVLSFNVVSAENRPTVMRTMGEATISPRGIGFGCWLAEYCVNFKVIGNIHQNPELLK